MYDRKTGTMVPTVLRNLKVFEISGVEKPANPHARVVLLKGPDVTAPERKLTLDTLPLALKVLPTALQGVFLEAANERLVDQDEEAAFKGAWSVVKTKFECKDGRWIEKNATPPAPDLSFLRSFEGTATPLPKEQQLSAMPTEACASAEGEFAKAEATLDALVAVRRERYDESEAVAMTKALDTPEGRRAYSAMVRAQASLKSPAPFLKERDSEPVFKNASERSLDALAERHAEAHGVTKPVAYLSILDTAEGRRLYSESLRP